MQANVVNHPTFSNLHCPNCNAPLYAQARSCPVCEANLGIAAIEETRRINTAVPKPSQVTSPEVLFPRIGEYLVEKGLITQAALREALYEQQAYAAAGESILLGNLLVAKELITREQLDTAITEQVIQLKSALEDSNRQLKRQVAEHAAELTQTMAELEKLDKMKSNFIANVSHELRTPLSLLVGHLDLISGGSLGALTPDQSQSIASMTRSTRRLWTLIEDLLQFSAAATGNMTLKLQPFPIANSLDTAVSQKKPQATERKILLNTRKITDLPQVYADQEKITWVVEQLLDNAIKFTPPSGKVVAYARPQANDVQIHVIDTGIGIPKNRLNELFRSFHQLEGSTTRRYEGMGLGLAMAQKILKAHGSKIQVRSRVGVGSHFAFALPCHG